MAPSKGSADAIVPASPGSLACRLEHLDDLRDDLQGSFVPTGQDDRLAIEVHWVESDLPRGAVSHLVALVAWESSGAAMPSSGWLRSRRYASDAIQAVTILWKDPSFMNRTKISSF